MATRTRSVDPRLSEEVRWYLRSRGIPYPNCPPRFLTPDGGQRRGARFDPDRVDRVLRAFSFLRHTQGRWAGQPLAPDPWQIAYILAPIFGWVHNDENGDVVRCTRKAFVEVPRKNGKTTTAGGIAIYMTGADGEPGAQVYAVAAGKDQARFLFDPVKALVEKSPALGPHFRPTASRIVHTPSSSYFAVVSSLADLLHGANVHSGLIDELHVHKSPALVQTVETGTGSRRQPLVMIITTADDGTPNTIYDQRRTRIEQLAEGVIADASTYGVVWGAEPEDLEGEAPFLERTWSRANPGFGISPSRSYMESAAADARQSPAQLANFARLHLGLRTKLDKRFLDLTAWDANAAPVPVEQLIGRPCWGGLDLAAVSDLCALCWDFPDFQGGHDAIWRAWAPEAALPALDKRTAGAARAWVREGLLELTPGNVTDYGFIRQRIHQDLLRYRVQEIGFDPWNSTQLVSDLLADGAPMVEVRQGYATMSPPTKELQRLLLEGSGGEPRYRHGGNPVARWCVSNFAIAMDPAGNVKPDRANARDKIDLAAASIIALQRAMAGEVTEGDELLIIDDPVEIGAQY